MSERYVVQERQGYDWYGVVVDSTDGRELCESDCHETPEDASVGRHFAPLLTELNVLAARLAAADEAAKTYRLAMALALSIPVSTITVESAQAWIEDWKARNE